VVDLGFGLNCVEGVEGEEGEEEEGHLILLFAAQLGDLDID
jgi:hypothetical protein